ncbi:fimbrial protein [uncultured Cedecea sp.]|uniref:fimbrial protein n=1 Tax=uncultured Cedecea sp. TaxID=988762 RepID=UPI0026102EC0|nr:fimbrial protein [uncultured Cedecea sp.]
MKKIILAALVSGVMATSAFAADNQGSGKVTFTGEIISAPCSISPESIDQTVPLGQIANSALVGGGTSPAQPFTIELEDCVLSSATQTVSVAFTGTSSAFDDGLLGITGLAINAPAENNVAIQINDSNGERIDINDVASQQAVNTLQNGNNTLLYSAFVRGDTGATVENIPLGRFSGVTNFTLTYN